MTYLERIAIALERLVKLSEPTVSEPVEPMIEEETDMQLIIITKVTEKTPTKCRNFNRMVVMKSDNHKLPHCEECECKLEEYKPEPEPIEETKKDDDRNSQKPT